MIVLHGLMRGLRFFGGGLLAFVLVQCFALLLLIPVAFAPGGWGLLVLVLMILALRSILGMAVKYVRSPSSSGIASGGGIGLDPNSSVQADGAGAPRRPAASDAMVNAALPDLSELGTVEESDDVSLINENLRRRRWLDAAARNTGHAAHG